MESFSCQCKDGFLGNGYTCFEEPSDCNKTCHVDKLAILREFCDCNKDVNITTMGPTTTPYETTTSQFIVGNTTSEPVITNATTSTLTNTTTMPHTTTMPDTDGPTTSSEPIIINGTTIQTTMPHTDGPTTLVTNGTTTQSTTMTTTTATTTTTEPTTTMEPLTCKYYVILLLIEL